VLQDMYQDHYVPKKHRHTYTKDAKVEEPQADAVVTTDAVEQKKRKIENVA